MASDNKIELVVTVEVDKANQSIKSVNANLSGIEQTAVRAARGASHGIDGMTAAMVKGATAGNLLADAIKKAIEWAKEWTVTAAKEAAIDERRIAVTRALAKAHGDSTAAAQNAVEAIQEIGYTSDDATASVQKLIIADIGLEKSKGLARIAKDAAAVSTEGLGAAEAFEKIILAIETGQSRGLRSMSLFPDLAKAEQVATLQAQFHGRALSDLEIKQVRYNAIVQAATSIQGSSAEAAATVKGQMDKLGREIHELQQDVGKAFQGELLAVVGIFKTMIGFFRDHTDAIEKFGKGILVLVGIIATITAATKAWALAQGALNLAMAVNPAFLLAGGIIGAGAILWKEYSDIEITDKKVLQQIVDIAKQTYGGNIDMTIRTQQVRDLIQLYAMSTGKQTKGMPATVHPLELVQSGGSLYQSPGYSNGTALPGLGGLPTLDSIGSGVATNAGPVVIQLDGPATTSLLRGEAVQAIASNPRVVQGAVMSASKSNAGRRELTSLQLSPGLVTS